MSADAPHPSPTPQKTLEIIDTPRVGWILWLALGGFLIPPVLMILYGIWMEPLPYQQLWIVLLLAPIPLIVFSLPRHYRLDASALVVVGSFYRVNIPRAEIERIQPISIGKALLHPGSLFCSDPAKALLIERKARRALVISPENTAPFLAANPRSTAVQ